MRVRATVELWQKGRWFLAKVPELDFVAQGKTAEEAKTNLKAVINIQFTEMREMGTLDDYLAECGFVVRNDTAEPENEMVGFEKQLLNVP